MSSFPTSSRFDADELGRPVLRNFSGRWEMSLGATGSTDDLYKSMGAGWFSRAVINAVKGSLSMSIFHSPTSLKIEEKSSLGTFIRELLIDGRYHKVKQIDGSVVDVRLSIDRYTGDALIVSKLSAGLYVEVLKVMKRTVIEQNLYFFKGVLDLPENGFETLPPGVSVTRFWSKIETPEEAMAGEDQERNAASSLGRRVSSVTLGFTHFSEKSSEDSQDASDELIGSSIVSSMIHRLSTLESTPEVHEDEGAVVSPSVPPPSKAVERSASTLPASDVGHAGHDDDDDDDDDDTDSVSSRTAPEEEEQVEVEEDVVVTNPNYVYTSPDFSGTWSVDKSKSQSLDAMLALMGVPWVARKVADSLDVITKIDHNVKENSVQTVDKTAMGEMASTSIVSDGVAVPKKGNDGKIATITCTVSPVNETKLPPAADTHYPGTPLGCLRIVTELPDNLGVTDNTWTLMEGGQHMRQCIIFTKGPKTVVTHRVMVNKTWEPAQSQYKAKIDAVNHANARMVVKKKVLKPKSVALKLKSKLDTSSVEDVTAGNVVHLSSPQDPMTPTGTAPFVSQESENVPTQSPLQAWHDVRGDLLSNSVTNKPSEITYFPRGHASSGLLSPSKNRSSVLFPVHAEGINETDPFFTSLNGVWGITPFTPLPKNVRSAFAKMRNATKKACGSNALRFFPTSTTKDALYPPISDVNYLFSNSSGFNEPTNSDSRDIHINVFHRQDQIIVCDRYGFGTGGQQLPVNNQWYAIPLAPRRLKYYKDPKTGAQVYGEPPAERRWCLMRAVQTDGAGDLGANWLGKEIGEIPPTLVTAAAYSSSSRVNYAGLKRLAEKLPGSSNPRRPYFSAFPIEDENYKGAQLRLEKYFVDFTVDDVLHNCTPYIPSLTKTRATSSRTSSVSQVDASDSVSAPVNQTLEFTDKDPLLATFSTPDTTPSTPSRKVENRPVYTLESYEKGAFFEWHGALPTDAPHAVITLNIASIDTLEHSVQVTIPGSGNKSREYNVTRSLIVSKGEEALASIKMEENYRFALIRALLLSRRSGADQLRKGVLLRLEMFEDEMQEEKEKEKSNGITKEGSNPSYVTFDTTQSIANTSHSLQINASDAHNPAHDLDKAAADACAIM